MSKVALTVLAESVDIVGALLDKDSLRLDGIDKSVDCVVGLVNLGVIFSDGLVDGDCLEANSCCFFAMASCIRERSISIPPVSCAMILVTLEWTPTDRVLLGESKGLLPCAGRSSSLRVSIVFVVAGEVGDPYSELLLEERCL